jgi:Fe-S oxidoreductase
MSLNDYEKMMSSCIRCSNCKFIPALQVKSQKFSTICPSIERYNFHAYSGGGKMIIGLAMLRNRFEYSDELRNVVYKCTACGGCDISCKFFFELEPLEVIEQVRAHVVEKSGPLPEHRKWMESISQNHNPYNEPHRSRIEWLPKDVVPSKDSDTAYFVGCTASYRRMEIAQATAKIFDSAGLKFTLLGSDEYCCGSPLMRIGARKDALDLMRGNVERMKKLGVKRIVTSCAGCYSMFKVEYPRYLKTDFQVLHTSQLLETLLKNGELQLTERVPLKVTYHDPCHLGRISEPYIPWNGKMTKVLSQIYIPIPPKVIRRGSNGIYEAPRNILRSIPGVQLVEMERIKEYAYCCGAGGGVKSAFPDFALWTANNRIEEAEATGAEALVSCCPFCSTNLKDAIKQRGDNLAFYDLTELVLRSMGGGA